MSHSFFGVILYPVLYSTLRLNMVTGDLEFVCDEIMHRVKIKFMVRVS